MNWHTPDAFNQFSELSDYNLFTSDRALTETLGPCTDWSLEQLTAFGARLGSAETCALADNANRHPPELHAFDALGRRIDFVDFHPSWRSVLAMYPGAGLVSLPFSRRVG
jgi:putative acyl-CoA dehydrogenase